MKIFNKTLGITLCLGLMVVLGGCFLSPKESTPSTVLTTATASKDTTICTETDFSSVPSITMETSATVAPGSTKRVGEVNFGFVTVPYKWVNFTDANSDGSDRQFSDPSGKDILTLRYLSPENANMSLDQWSSSISDLITSQGATNVITASVTLNDKDAYQIYGNYDDGTILVIWIFANEDGSKNYVSVKSSETNVMTLVTMVENTFSLTEEVPVPASTTGEE